MNIKETITEINKLNTDSYGEELFEKTFKGESVDDIIDNIESYQKEFKLADVISNFEVLEKPEVTKNDFELWAKNEIVFPNWIYFYAEGSII